MGSPLLLLLNLFLRASILLAGRLCMLLLAGTLSPVAEIFSSRVIIFVELLVLLIEGLREGTERFERFGPEDVEGMVLFPIEVEGGLSSSWSSLRILFLGGDCEVDIR